MAKSTIEIARDFLKRRKFSKVITLLEANEEMYEGVFECFYLLGTACLYVGDTGNASRYYRKAREIRIRDVNLLLGQAAIYLKRGDTANALQYYMEVLDIDPNNDQASGALDFIRYSKDYDEIVQLDEVGKLKRFYPSLGLNPDVVRNIVLTGIAAGLLVSLVISLIPPKRNTYIGPRANLERLALSKDEKVSPGEKNLSNTVVRYIMDAKSINRSYEDALNYFQNHHDNAAQVEINRLLNSNASFSIKQKATTLMSYLESQTFDTLKDNYSYQQVEKDLKLYLDTYVAWSGKISNAREMEGGTWTCDLLVGYEDNKTVEGVVPVTFNPPPAPEIDGSRPVRILGRVTEEEGRVLLVGKSVYQPMVGHLLNGHL